MQKQEAGGNMQEYVETLSKMYVIVKEFKEKFPMASHFLNVNNLTNILLAHIREIDLDTYLLLTERSEENVD